MNKNLLKVESYQKKKEDEKGSILKEVTVQDKICVYVTFT